MVLTLVASLVPTAVAHPDESALTASFSSDVTTGPAPLTVHFMDRSTGNPTGWQWDFGDGSSSTRQDPTYTFQTPGTYNVTLTVTDGYESSTASSEIRVTTAPAATPQPIRVVPVPVYPVKPGDGPDKPVYKKPDFGKAPDTIKKPDRIKKPDTPKKPDKSKRGGERGNADNPIRHF